MASVTFGKVQGIPLRIHWTLIVTLPLFAYVMGRFYFAADPADAVPSAAALAWGAALAILLFASVLLHELGHSLTARRYGLDVGGITLFPLGGVSGLERSPRRPNTEIVFTVMGPLVNFVIGIPLLALAWFLTGGDLLAAVAGAPHWIAFVFWAGALNVFIGAFNLFVPAFPMDGGRILRAVLAKSIGFVKATHVAAWTGRLLAVAMGIAGFLIGNVLLILIAFFVWAGAGAEEQQVEARARQGGRPAA